MAREKLTVSKKLCGFRLNVELVKMLKILAIEQNIPVNLLLEEAIQEVLKKYNGSGKQAG